LKLEFNSAGPNMPDPDVIPSSPPMHKKKSRRAAPSGGKEDRLSPPPERKEATLPSPPAVPLAAMPPRPTEAECNAHAAENVRHFREALRALHAGTADSAAIAQHAVFNLCMAGKPEREAFAETHEHAARQMKFFFKALYSRANATPVKTANSNRSGSGSP
jgi:hypothetical protein